MSCVLVGLGWQALPQFEITNGKTFNKLAAPLLLRLPSSLLVQTHKGTIRGGHLSLAGYQLLCSAKHVVVFLLA